MKKYRLIALLCLIFASCNLIGCDFNKNSNDWELIIEEINTDEVIDYNDNLVDLTSICFESEYGIDNIYSSGSSEDLQWVIDTILAECNKSLTALKKVPAREWDTSLRDAVLPIIELEIAYYEKFQDLVPFQDLDNNSFTEDQFNSYEAIQDELDAIDEDIAAANEKLIKVQEEFAKNHWYELEGLDNETIDKSETYSYEDLQNLDDSVTAAITDETINSEEVNNNVDLSETII